MDITFYYSGATVVDGAQDNPMKSIGGLQSAIMIPNGRFDNLFDEVGIYEVQQGQEISRCIFVKNTKGIAITDLSLFITGKQDFEKIEFAISTPDENGAVQMLSSQYDLPYNTTFYEAYVDGDKVVLKQNFAVNEVFALWLRRTIDVTDQRKKTTTLSLTFDYT